MLATYTIISSSATSRFWLVRKNNALHTLVYAETISRPDWPNYRYIYQNRQAYYAIEFSTASLCWSLASKASALCQTLGYHRAVTSHDRVVTNSKYTRFFFWTTYYLDKSLSLRLGRASTIQDWDVTAIPSSTSSTNQEPVFAFFALWVKTARCQGDIYEMLYSPAAAAQPEQVRRSRVGSLASSLYDIAQETERTKVRFKPCEDRRNVQNQWLKTVKENTEEHLMDFHAVSDEVLRLSLLTHVYRAAPRDTQSLQHSALHVSKSPEPLWTDTTAA
ncbi:fungal-specific transcription factor domain-containing protein [Aureobasidium pullulans]|nr:fungal-specific transcription factor domain-containing protein [Aureobasidium pullulans]